MGMPLPVPIKLKSFYFPGSKVGSGQAMDTARQDATQTWKQASDWLTGSIQQASTGQDGQQEQLLLSV